VLVFLLGVCVVPFASYLILSLFSTPTEEAKKSHTTKVCAICNKAAVGTQIYLYVSKDNTGSILAKDPTRVQEAWLCAEHLSNPPEEVPWGRVEGNDSEFHGTLLVLTSLLLVWVIVFFRLKEHIN